MNKILDISAAVAYIENRSRAVTPSPKLNIEIRPYRSADAASFRELNEEWIAKYFQIEDQDRRVLEDPEGHVLARGGRIYIVTADELPIGCCALIPAEPGVFELGKMSVAETCRGLGIGRKLLEYTIAEAKAMGAKTLCLASNSRLANAVHLYESVGFRHLPPERVAPSPYARSNVFMDLEL